MFAALRAAASRLLSLFSSRRLDSDFHQELDAHLEMLTDQNIRSGMAPDEARRQAHIALGNLAQLREIQRERQGIPHFEIFYRDLRYAARTLRRSPGFTLVAVLALALGIGVNTTLFSAFNAVALKPLPVKDPASVLRVERWFASGSLGNGQYSFSYPEYLYYRAHARSWSSLEATSWRVPVIAHLTPGAAPETLHGELVSGNYFSGLGVDAMLGRTFTAEENRTPGAHPVIILSHPFWRVRFNADPQVLGKTIRLSDTAFTIVGVTSQDFIGTGNPPQVPDFWAPLMMQAELVVGQDWLNAANAGFLKLYGRLQPGTSFSLAQSEMTVIARQFEETNHPRDKTVAVTVEPATFFGETNTLQFRAFVALLMLIVGMVLLIACANLTNMLLARASGRYREIGVRLALGASRSRLIRQLLTESVLLALLGGAAGVLFSAWASKLLWISLQEALQAFLWSNVTLVINTSPDMRVLGYTLLVSLITGILFGLAPALQASKRDVSAALKEAGSAFLSLSRSRLRSFLLAGQVAASMLLLLTAGLLVRGLVRSQAADPGFETRRVFGIMADYGNDPVRATALYRQVVERLQALPQVRSVALVYQVPMTGTWTPRLRAPDTQTANPPDRTLANYVSPSYFETLGVPIVRGRTFSRQESEQGARVAIVSETTARRIWPAKDPLGKHAQLDLDFRNQWTDFEIVGVVKDVRNANLSRIDPAYFYFPTALPHWNNILFRAVDESKATQSAIRTSIEALDRTLAPSLRMGSLEDFAASKQRLLAKTYAMFAVVLAALALALAGLGIYGVMSYLVSQRVREIGIHMALGAQAVDVVGGIVRQGLRPVFLGALAGIIAAVAVTTILKATLVFPGSADLFFGVSYVDPVTFLSLSAFLAVVAAAASAIPARRATRVDPMEALRYE